MLTWLMNLDFAGGTGPAVAADVHYRRSGIKRRSGYPAWTIKSIVLFLIPWLI